MQKATSTVYKDTTIFLQEHGFNFLLMCSSSTLIFVFFLLFLLDVSLFRYLFASLLDIDSLIRKKEKMNSS